MFSKKKVLHFLRNEAKPTRNTRRADNTAISQISGISGNVWNVSYFADRVTKRTFKIFDIP